MRGESITDLIATARREAGAADFPIDEPVYHRAGRDPKDPILIAGSLDAPVCFVGRDLGKDEVAHAQPLIGAAGRLVRLGVLKARGVPAGSQPRLHSGPPLQEALEYVLLTNIVPFKPPGNKAYSPAVRRRFRPILEQLLADYWQGHHVITLGTEAFQWFEPYADASEFARRGKTESRFQTSFQCQLPRHHSAGNGLKRITVYPLPHPSPLNRRWYDRFPSMLAERLAEVLKNTGDPVTSGEA